MYYVKCLVDFCLVHESDGSSNDVSDESYDNDEEKMWMIY